MFTSDFQRYRYQVVNIPEGRIFFMNLGDLILSYGVNKYVQVEPMYIWYIQRNAILRLFPQKY